MGLENFREQKLGSGDRAYRYVFRNDTEARRLYLQGLMHELKSRLYLRLAQQVPGELHMETRRKFIAEFTSGLASKVLERFDKAEHSGSPISTNRLYQAATAMQPSLTERLLKQEMPAETPQDLAKELFKEYEQNLSDSF